MTNSLKVFNQLLDEGEIHAIFEKLDKLPTKSLSNFTVLNRLRMEFIMGVSGIAYLDFVERLRVFIKMLLDKQAITLPEMDTIGKFTFQDIHSNLEGNIENTPKILGELIIIEKDTHKKQILANLLNKWYDYENRYQSIPNVKINTLKSLKIQIKNEVLILLKPQIS